VTTPVVLRRRATLDIDNAVDFYRRQGGSDLAGRFVDALERTLLAVSEHPLAGLSRFADELGLPDLRSRWLEGFPYIAFYATDGDTADVWRVLHARSDVPASLRSCHFG